MEVPSHLSELRIRELCTGKLASGNMGDRDLLHRLGSLHVVAVEADLNLVIAARQASNAQRIGVA